ncbi:MAG TPA: hypothetical protein ENK84_05695 [Desulfobulbus sp.]|nr:hypothetical protein [Desulfobulbus sp.]
MIENISYNPHTQSPLHVLENFQGDKTNFSNIPENDTKDGVQDRITLYADSGAPLTYSASMNVHSGEGAKYDMLQGLVANLLKEQGIEVKVTTENGEIDISAVTPQEAKDLTDDDGYFGVDKTSDRIVKLAIGIAGGDPSRIDAIKEGVDKGFQEALKAFDGKLPDISYDTYDAVMEKLDKWVSESTKAA